MRIGDWSSDVCSSDLANLIPDFSPKPAAAHRPDDRRIANGALGPHQSKGQTIARRQGATAVKKSGQTPAQDRQSVVEGRRVTVRVDLGGRRQIKKTRNPRNKSPTHIPRKHKTK